MGLGTHADVHALVFSNGGARLWAATDGGVFRSDRPQDGAGGSPTVAAFYPATTGCRSRRATTSRTTRTRRDSSPPACRTTAAVFRLSSSVWKRIANMGGDGGGVLPRPLNPDHWICQYIRGNWSTSRRHAGRRQPADAGCRGIEQGGEGERLLFQRRRAGYHAAVHGCGHPRRRASDLRYDARLVHRGNTTARRRARTYESRHEVVHPARRRRDPRSAARRCQRRSQGTAGLLRPAHHRLPLAGSKRGLGAR